MDIKTPGIFALTDLMRADQLTSFALNVEKHGYGSLWFPEGLGRDPFSVATHILTVTKKLIVGTGIANVWKREPVSMISAARTLAEMFPERFILGIGISHGPMMAQLGYKYEKPVAFMRNYLARMKSAPYSGAAAEVRTSNHDRSVDAQDASAGRGPNPGNNSRPHDSRTDRANARRARPR